MSVVSLDPAVGLLHLQDNINRLLRNPTGPTLFGPSRTSVFPPLNIFTDHTDHDALVIRAELPGFKSDEIDVDLEQRRLTISGKHAPVVFDNQDGGYHRRERRSGAFRRSLQLPEHLDATAAKAGYRNGILTIRIPRRPEDKPHRVQISQG